MKKSVTILMLLFLMMNSVSAQDFSVHQWENRVLLVMATSKDSKLLQQQIEIFNQNEAGLKERKLLIFLMAPNEIATYNPRAIEWSPFTAPLENYKSQDSEIELLLIGLDGQNKIRKYIVTSAIEIFVTIDGMPMRQSELRNSNKQD
jgi:hypothetical protein